MAGRNLLAPEPAPKGRNLLAPQPGSVGVDTGPVEPSLLSRIANSEQVRDLINPSKGLQAADDMARIFADTATFGFLDPLIGEGEREKTQAARERAGWAGTAMDVTSALTTAPAIAGKLVPAAKGAWPAVARMLGYGAEGAGQAALSAYGHGERDPSALLKDALIGGGLSTAASGVGGMVGELVERYKAKAGQQFKSFKDLEAAAGKKYDAVDASGSMYKLDDTDAMLAKLDDVLTNERATSGLDDRAIAVVNRLKKDWAGKPISPTELDKVRRWVREKLIASDPRGPDAVLGKKLMEEIDSFTKGTSPIDPVSGAPDPKVIADLDEARSLRSRGYRAKDVEKAEAKAKKQAKRTGSAITGGNIENTTRQQFGKLDDKIDAGGAGSGGWTGKEVEGIKKIAEGSLGRNIGRMGAAISPVRGSVPALIHAIAAPLSGGLSTVAGMGGELAAQLGKRATARQVEELAALVRDPAGKGISTDPAAVQQYRDILARMMQGSVRAGGGP